LKPPTKAAGPPGYPGRGRVAGGLQAAAVTAVALAEAVTGSLAGRKGPPYEYQRTWAPVRAVCVPSYTSPSPARL